MFKKLALTLVFLFPLVSFAQTIQPTNADILLRIQALEAIVATLQQELAQIVASEKVVSTPVFGSTVAATSTEATQETQTCDGHAVSVQTICHWSIDHELGPA